MKMKKQSLQWLGSGLVVVLAAVWFFAAVSALESGHREEDVAQMEESLRRAAVSCYALEGFYPPDAAYLRENYAIQIDEERYLIHYQAIAENLMPEITVISRK